ncbi:uncharacterized protein RAG0_02065 [Rhynchosporium agropyri]|uniref:Uncharacterized protein n=1 Tax=Rhynchosporium agropyri TaxID=914238 RepID=A0A1E1K050_9HELO|nr:uncharacterized protein RAG0_02065 [Rhynchosporium agropyri]
MSPTSTGSGRMLRRTVLQYFLLPLEMGDSLVLERSGSDYWLVLRNFFGGGDSKGGSLARDKGAVFWGYESMEQLSSTWDSKD